MRKSALGNTLDSIFDDLDGFGSESTPDSLQTMRIGEIEPNRDQPREDFDPERLEELAESIRRHGLIQPITVRTLPVESGLAGGTSYQIVAGERRWRAARMAGLEEVPVRIMELTDAQTMQIAMIENLQREDLNPVEEAKGYRDLIENYEMTQESLAKTVGKARSSIANSMRLLTLPDEVLDLVKRNQISKGHCKAIMSAQSTSTMIQLAKRAASGELSVRETERLARLTKEDSPPPKPPAAPKNIFFKETELALSESLSTTVKIKADKNRKTLCIDFADEDMLKEIIRYFIKD